MKISTAFVLLMMRLPYFSSSDSDQHVLLSAALYACNVVYVGMAVTEAQ